MHLKQIPSSLLLSLVTASALYAQSQNPITAGYLELLPIDTLVTTLSLEELTQVVITDTKMAQSRDKVTQKMEIIDHTQFERLSENNRNLAELMQYTSGQFVNVLSRNDANWGGYAGLGPKYNTYMLDGLPIDSFTDAMSLDPWAFERVEIQKGPAAILYSNYLTMDFAGNESPLAGTTNFILRDKIEGEMSRANIGVGSYNTHNARLYHQNRHGDLNYFIGGNIERSDYTQYGGENSWLQTTEDPNYQKSKIYGKISYKPSENDTLSLFAHLTRHTGDVGRPNRDYNHTYQTLNLKYSHRFNDAFSLQLQGGWRDYDRNFDEDFYSTSFALKEKGSVEQSIIPIDLTLSYLHGNGSVLSIGSDAQWTDYQSATTSPLGVKSIQNDMKAQSNSLFIQEKWVNGDWIFRGGLRYNRIQHDYTLLGGTVPSVDEVTWNKIVWNAGVRWNAAKNFSVYANSGTSFMTPAGKQVGGSSGQSANPSLKPEEGMGNDIGIEWEPLSALHLGLRAFYNIINDAIVDNAGSPTQSFNAGTTTAQGLEIDLSHQYSDTIDYFANFTYNDTKVEDPQNVANDGSNIPFVPRYIANVGVTAFLPFDITASGYVQRVGSYYSTTDQTSRTKYGNYHTLNAKLQKNLIRNRDYSLNALIELNNLGGIHHPLPWDFENTGFNAHGTIALSF